MLEYSWRSMSINVDFPQPEGADRTIKSGLVFIVY